MMGISCFLPCRKGSQRVKNKNIRKFSEYKYGLIEIKLKQLLAVDEITEIVLSTNDQEIIDYAKSLNESKIVIHVRNENLASSETSTDDLVKLAESITHDEHILWTHVTSPFLNTKEYQSIINTYYKSINNGFDSLATVNEIRGFIWNDKNPLNYDRTLEKWPRTQEIPPIYEINSGVFLATRNIYINYSDRLGQCPYFYTMDKIKGTDIDWPEDFKLAEMLLDNNLVEV